MKRYEIIIAPRAKKQIDKLPLHIKFKVGNTLLNVMALDPFVGKALKAELKGLYSYRLGEYRIIYSILKTKLIVQVIKVMHRREAYR
ncbi:MAG: type II toxin-antitoxin system RelE/ParE family toxin [Candidatus Omnitrophica bacterium]|nr:type II toxin-antitoxin system RelE/ParE family toxin [Candidatus Omnitrophota bacterium]